MTPMVSVRGHVVHGFDEKSRTVWEDSEQAPERQAQEGGLSPIAITDGDGRFHLSTPLGEYECHQVTVDIAPGALRIRSGRVARWVALPPDALVDLAAIEAASGVLTISIPMRERRRCRHIVHVW